MMNCWRARPLLTAFLDRELAPGDEKEVEVHLESCEACAELCGRLADVPAIQAPALDPSLQARLWEDLDASIEAARGRPAAPRFREPTGWSRTWEGLRARELSLPLPAVLVYGSAATLLLGWGLFSYQRVQVLSAQVEAKDEVIRVLRSTASRGAAPLDTDAAEVEYAEPLPPGPTLPGIAVGDFRTVSTGAAGPPAEAIPQGYYHLVQ